MLYSKDQPRVRMAVRALSECPNWNRTFTAAGWRPFGSCDSRTGLSRWLLKRGNDVVAFSQSTYGPLTQSIDMPQDAGAELSALMVSSGLAVPA